MDAVLENESDKLLLVEYLRLWQSSGQKMSEHELDVVSQG